MRRRSRQDRYGWRCDLRAYDPASSSPRGCVEQLHSASESRPLSTRIGSFVWRCLTSSAWLRFHIHRVTGGGHPPPVPTERGVRISRTNALRKLVHSTASACSSEYGRRSLGGSNGVRSLIWLKASQVRRRPAQLRLHNIRRQ